ncbi:hypothetical protein [Glaciibacter superstes]|nr:hypothetical protein [Glaciibacter superstes]
MNNPTRWRRFASSLRHLLVAALTTDSAPRAAHPPNTDSLGAHWNFR